jgi:septum formation protein
LSGRPSEPAGARADGPDFVLASASPRRRQLLTAAGLVFEVKPAEINERPLADEGPVGHVERLARAKALASLPAAGGRPVLAADTVVALAGRIFGKPADLDEAKAMLTALSGQVHQVVTAWCAAGGRRGQNAAARSVSTDVGFRTLTAGEIDWYLGLGESLDKAGAYAVQGAGGFLLDFLAGSFLNVVGLPLAEVLTDLEAALGRPPRRRWPAPGPGGASGASKPRESDAGADARTGAGLGAGAGASGVGPGHGF